MIIKGSQRGSGANLAAHLMRIDENKHVRVHEIKGFAADNLHDAFKEAEAISLGTKCRQYLFSVSVNPVPVEVFEDTFDRIEKQLGLEGQPRAIVFHEKESRLHAHVVWSRIDAETMTATHLPFFKNRLFNLARDLHLDFGWEMPRGMLNKGERDPNNFSLAEWQQAKRQGVDPRWLKRSIQDCWSNSDSLRAFLSSLQERGFFLAKGDRRGHVVVDHTGEVYALSRMLDVKAKGIRARLGQPDNLKSVEDKRYGYPSESFNINTRLIEVAAVPELRSIIGDIAYDAASYPAHRWIGQGVRSAFTLYNKITSLYPSTVWPCSPGGLWDFFGRDPQQIESDLEAWPVTGACKMMRACACRSQASLNRVISGMPISRPSWSAFRGFSQVRPQEL